MHFGKREQIVVVFIGTALLIFLVHLLIFQPRATEYARVKQEFEAGVKTLSDTESASPKQIQDYALKTTKYEEELTSLAAELRLTIPKHYARLGTESVQLRMKDTLDALRQLVEMRKRIKAPQLTFLDDKKDAYGIQQGWNIPEQLSERALGVQGAIWDVVSKLMQRWDVMSLAKTPLDKLRQRAYYNQFLQQLALPPPEICDWVAAVPGLGYVFFNDKSLRDQLKSVSQLQVTVQANPYSINRFGPLLPVFKRLWVAELVWAKRDPNTQITKEQLFEALEVYPKYYPTDHGIVVANKELEALVDICKLAEKHGILEISKVALLKIAPIEKAVRRVPGATPTPSPTPAAPAGGAMRPGVMGFEPGMGGFEPGMGAMPGMAPGGMPGMAAAVATPDPSKQIGSAGGLELEMRAYNANLVKFLFELTHGPRTYAVDDLYIYANPNGELRTSMTVELVTNLDALK